MIFKYRFCLWLVDTLSMQPLTFEKIQKKWFNSSANEDGEALFERTFNRYRREAEALMHVDIICDKRDGNLYKVVRPDSFKNYELQQWLLSAFRISSLAEHVNGHKYVMLDSAPPAAHLLQTVMDAIDRKQSLKFRYQSHYKDSPNDVELIPAFVRLFKQRWYVIGEVAEKKCAMSCALERISDLEIMEDKRSISKGLSKLLNPETYFEHCFGIIRQFEPEIIRFRAFWPQNAYLRDVPIHISQTEVAKSEDYTDFEIYVRPTYDLKQEFLWNRDKMAVLSPESFRQDMINVLKATLEGYETGENHAIDE